MYKNTMFNEARKPISKLQHNKLTEAFRYYPDDSTIMQQDEIASRVAIAIAKKAGIGGDVSLSDIPYTYTKDNEAFAGYIAFLADGRALRISFLMSGNSQRITSIEVYNEPGSLDNPDQEMIIEDPNLNIIQIVNGAASMLDSSLTETTKHPARRARTITEGRKEEMIAYLQSAGGSGNYRDYLKWATSQGKDIGSNTLFYAAKKAANLPTADVGFTIQPAAPEEPLYDPEDADVFEEDMSQDAIKKFEFYESTLRNMADADPELWAMFVYGNPGLGKSYLIKHILFKEEVPTLKKNNLKVVVKSGAISGFTGLLQVLYDHRKDHILVLDDNDNLLVKNQAAANILKAALQTETEERHITYSRADMSALFAPDEDEIPEEGIEEEFGDEEPMVVNENQLRFPIKKNLRIFERDGRYLFETAKEKRTLTEADFVNKSKDTIKDFYFESRIIFVSNLLEVPAAVGDRCIKVNMLFTPEQILELIRKNMNHLQILTKKGPLSEEMKMEVYNFMKRGRAEIERRTGKPMTLTYRMFRNSCICYNHAIQRKLGSTTAKRWVVGQLEADLGGKK